jgi:hypothetical protein
MHLTYPFKTLAEEEEALTAAAEEEEVLRGL